MEIVPNLHLHPFWLKVWTRDPRSSICVRTFSLFTITSLRRCPQSAPLGNRTAMAVDERLHEIKEDQFLE